MLGSTTWLEVFLGHGTESAVDLTRRYWGINNRYSVD